MSGRFISMSEKCTESVRKAFEECPAAIYIYTACIFRSVRRMAKQRTRIDVVEENLGGQKISPRIFKEGSRKCSGVVGCLGGREARSSCRHESPGRQVHEADRSHFSPAQVKL